VSGGLPAGAPLREQELCAELGISRTPLREAIRTLAREGLVRLQPNRSAVIAPLDVAAVENLYMAIGHIEALGGRLACRLASDANIAALSILHHEMLIFYHRRELAAYIRHNGRIHRAQLELSRNDVLVEMWEMLHPRVERARTAANLYPERWHAAVGEHEAMLKALAARDEDRLAALMETHYTNGLRVLRAAAPAPSE
jgi:DNA-binding GntR family transcriptional regulator